MRLMGVGVLLASLFLIRPAHLGEAYNFFGAAIFFLISTLILNRRTTEDFHRVFWQAIALFGLWAFLCVHAIYMGVTAPYPVYSFVVATLVATGAIFSLADRETHRRVLTGFIFVLVAFGASALVTFVISLVVPLNALRIGHLTVPTYQTGDVYFPFTIEYGLKNYAWGTWPRAGGGWRESGIAQCLYAWALLIVLANRSFPYRKLAIACLVIGCLAAQSTIGFANLAFVIAVYALLFRRANPVFYFAVVILVIPLVAWLGYIAYFDTSIGFASKVDGESFADRYNAVDRSLASLRENPFGFGVYGSLRVKEANSGINLIASMASFGVIGAFLILLNWFANQRFTSWRKLKIFACLPIYATMLTSQPLLDAMAIFIILMLDPGVLRSQLEGKRPKVRRQPRQSAGFPGPESRSVAFGTQDSLFRGDI